MGNIKVGNNIKNHIEKRPKAIKKKYLVLSLIVFIIAFMLVFLLFSASTAGLRSDLALQVQGLSFKQESVFNQVGLKLDVPTGKDYSGSGWCKNMKLYHPGEVFPHNGVNGEMSILYNFGRFENGRSTFYDPDSDCYNAHYGVYAIQLEQGAFGWKNGALDVDAIVDVVSFDQLDLVMESLGCPISHRYFEYQITDIKEGPEMAGFSDWIQIDAMIETNSPLHHQTENLIGYLQYGTPPKNYNGEDFPVVSTKGRLYLRYDETRNVTVIYFVIEKTQELIDQTSKDYLMPIQWN